MAICPNCGARRQCDCEAGQLHLEDVMEVVAFLRNELGLSRELSVRNFFLSLTVATAHCASYIARHGRASEALMTTVPNWNSTSLRRILRLLLPSKAEVEQILGLAKSFPPADLYQRLVALRRQGLFGLLAVYNWRYMSRRYMSRRARSPPRETGTPSTAGTPGTAGTAVDASKTGGMHDVGSVYGSLLEQSFPAAVLFNFDNTAAEDLLVASLVRTVYSVDKAISTLGHSKLDTDMGVRIVRAVYVTPYATPVLGKLILAHELIHVALWFHTPHCRTGVHSLEEVFCHAGMSLYADALLAAASPLDQQIVLHRTRVCELDARRRSAVCYAQWRQQLALRHSQAALDSCLNAIGGTVGRGTTNGGTTVGGTTNGASGNTPGHTSGHVPRCVFNSAPSGIPAGHIPSGHSSSHLTTEQRSTGHLATKHSTSSGTGNSAGRIFS
ncbi:hypothetical protein GNI_051210 [Gregarina niphandrodes]|uniref:Uncharacterized protein n=1 Tax=Gregarina niphandrodes TaxID=110365 RepID=A0A023B9C0_GRENI|nr:hypothetical protein GNI_051210 [Gregarina niphandrodes]EZG72378.1 hypothetical protein GNI_051210 [Gregarina niphandrodes]|eukprot:XP_011129776.1 hypothetical protein GNI_051210 [Gregarina niphandrodes]